MVIESKQAKGCAHYIAGAGPSQPCRRGIGNRWSRYGAAAASWKTPGRYGTAAAMAALSYSLCQARRRPHFMLV